MLRVFPKILDKLYQYSYCAIVCSAMAYEKYAIFIHNPICDEENLTSDQQNEAAHQFPPFY